MIDEAVVKSNGLYSVLFHLYYYQACLFYSININRYPLTLVMNVFLICNYRRHVSAEGNLYM